MTVVLAPLPVRRPGRCYLAAALAALAVGQPAARAGGPIVDAVGFEAPYTSGNLVPSPPLAGQQGWKKSTVGTGQGVATVQSAVKLSGAQSLQVTRGAGSYDRWAVPNLSGFPTGRFILVSWDMRVEQTPASAGTFGPVIGVETYASNSNPFSLMGMFGVDAQTGEVIYQEPMDGFYTAPGPTVTFGAWNRYRILLDYTQQQFRTYFNDALIAAGEFVDKPTGSNFTTISDASILAGAAAQDATSLALTGTAYFDNFVVQDGIPGDFDQDGDVDGADLATWKSSAGVNAGADSDGDGDSDGADLLIWQKSLSSFDYTPAAVIGSPIPEPASGLLAAATLIAACRRRGYWSAR